MVSSATTYLKEDYLISSPGLRGRKPNNGWNQMLSNRVKLSVYSFLIRAELCFRYDQSDTFVEGRYRNRPESKRSSRRMNIHHEMHGSAESCSDMMDLKIAQHIR